MKGDVSDVLNLFTWFGLFLKVRGCWTGQQFRSVFRGLGSFNVN